MTSVRTAALPTSWQAPVADRPVRGPVAVPGSKSLTNRALILAAQATGPSLITAPLRSRDTDLMADALRALGTSITDSGTDWAVTPGPLTGPARDRLRSGRHGDAVRAGFGRHRDRARRHRR